MMKEIEDYATSRLTHWGRVTHICVSELSIIGSDNGLSPNHYLEQCWLIFNWSLRNKHQWNFDQNSNIFIEANPFQNVWKMAAMLSRPQCVNKMLPYVNYIGKVFIDWFAGPFCDLQPSAQDRQITCHSKLSWKQMKHHFAEAYTRDQWDVLKFSWPMISFCAKRSLLGIFLHRQHFEHI